MSDKMGLGIAETLLVLGEDDADYATMLFSVKVTASFVNWFRRSREVKIKCRNHWARPS